MTYTVRDDRGVMLMELENQLALKVINTTIGHFRSYRTRDNPNVKTVYQIDDDTVFRAPFGRLFFWKNTLLIPD